MLHLLLRIVCSTRRFSFPCVTNTTLNLLLQARKAADDKLETQKLDFLTRRQATDQRLAARDVTIKKQKVEQEKIRQKKAQQQLALFREQARRQRERVQKIRSHEHLKGERLKNQKKRLNQDRGEQTFTWFSSSLNTRAHNRRRTRKLHPLQTCTQTMISGNLCMQRCKRRCARSTNKTSRNPSSAPRKSGRGDACLTKKASKSARSVSSSNAMLPS